MFNMYYIIVYRIKMGNLKKHIDKFHKSANFGDSFTYFLNFIVPMKHVANMTYTYTFTLSNYDFSLSKISLI